GRRIARAEPHRPLQPRAHLVRRPLAPDPRTHHGPDRRRLGRSRSDRGDRDRPPAGRDGAHRPRRPGRRGSLSPARGSVALGHGGAAGARPRGMIALDGRLARRETTRSAVVDALLALIEEGDRRPTAPRIAERAGVSLRSVFQHFTDLEALFAVAADRQTARIAALVPPVPVAGPLRRRIDVFVAQRARGCEAITPVRRTALLLEPFSREIAGRLQRGRTLARDEVGRVFARELARRRPAARRELLEALTVVGAW